MNRRDLIVAASMRFNRLDGATLIGCEKLPPPRRAEVNLSLNAAMLLVARNRRKYAARLLSFIDGSFDSIAQMTPADEPIEATAAGLINTFLKGLLIAEFGVDRESLLEVQMQTTYADLPVGMTQMPRQATHNESEKS